MSNVLNDSSRQPRPTSRDSHFEEEDAIIKDRLSVIREWEAMIQDRPDRSTNWQLRELIAAAREDIAFFQRRWRVVRVRNLTRAQVDWLANSNIGFGAYWTFAAMGRTWVEGSIENLEWAAAVLDSLALTEDLLIEAEDHICNSDLPRRLHAGWIDRYVAQRTAAAEAAVRKVHRAIRRDAQAHGLPTTDVETLGRFVTQT